MQRLRRHKARRRWILIGSVIVVAVAAFGSWRFLGSDGGTLAQAGASPHLAADTAPIIEAGSQGAAWEVDAGLWAADDRAADEEILTPQGGPVGEGERGRPARPVGEGGHLAHPVGEDGHLARPVASVGSEAAVADDPGIEAARRQYAAGQALEARHALNALLKKRLSPTDAAEVRRLLSQIADETLLSDRRLSGDPLADVYQVRSGDVLARIGQQYRVPAEILMRINGVRDATRLRADASIKVLRGPFHARIVKSEFRMDVYLQEQYVRSFRIGLGADQSTPEGVWRVKERLTNPTYYPPPSAPDKRIIPAGHPENPLGGHWIGLEGIEGDAVGRYGYGIHGTIEPETVGKAVSLGCIRMLNEDVALLYAMLLPGHSTVTIVP